LAKEIILEEAMKIADIATILSSNYPHPVF
jgi:hypothetical protein